MHTGAERLTFSSFLPSMVLTIYRSFSLVSFPPSSSILLFGRLINTSTKI
jgi:hypothetical protein